MNTGSVARVALLCGLLSAPAYAQLSDPTRPPGAGALQAGATDDAPVGNQLQSILLSRGRKVAVINGTMVPLGGKLGDAKVVRITESEVVLKTGEELETLKMFSGIDKQPVKRVSPGKRAAASAPGASARGGEK